jgi:hypothetical protein
MQNSYCDHRNFDKVQYFYVYMTVFIKVDETNRFAASCSNKSDIACT